MFRKLARRVIKPSSQSCSISMLANLGAKLSNVDIHRGQSTSLVDRGSEVEIRKLDSLVKVKGAFSVEFGILRRIASTDMQRSDSTHLMLAAEK